MSINQELRPFQINAAEAIALTKAIIYRKDALCWQNGGIPQTTDDMKSWPWQDVEEYLLLRSALEKLNKTAKGEQT